MPQHRRSGRPLPPTLPAAAPRILATRRPPAGIAAALAPFALAVILAVTATLTGCGEKTPPGEVTVMRACRICHGTDRICADIGKLDRAGWEKTVDRMIAGGANVAPEERAAVIDWLATRKPSEKPLCP